MISQISIKTGVGWISAFAYEGKIFKIKFGKLKKQRKSKILRDFKKNIIQFFDKKTSTIEAPHKIVGNKIQKKVWNI